MKKFKSLWLALVLIFCLPLVVWGAFPSTLTNAVDGVTEIFASHLNNMEAKVGVNNSSVTTSLDYMLRHSGSIDPGHKHTPPYGGTGNYTYAIGDLLYASSSSALSRLADVATGNALISGGVGAAPAWGKVALTTHISGVLPVANGGTNIATYAIGDLLYASSTSALSKLADVAVGQVLVSGGVTTAPAWSASPTITTSVTVPSVILGAGASAGTNKLAFVGTSNAATYYFSYSSDLVGASFVMGGNTPLFLTTTNVGLFGVTAFGTSASKVLGVGAGTAPTTAPVDMAQVWVVDLNGAGTAGLRFMNETAATAYTITGVSGVTAAGAGAITLKSPSANSADITGYLTMLNHLGVAVYVPYLAAIP